MDDETRGFIESLIDESLQEELTASAEWVQQQMPISSMRDLTLGYVLGALEGASRLVSALKLKKPSEKEEKEIANTIRAILKRRLPEIVKKVNRELNR